MQDRNHRRANDTQQFENFITVATTVEAVFVLHENEVRLIEEDPQTLNGGRGGFGEGSNDVDVVAWVDRGITDTLDANDAHARALSHESSSQGRGERGETTRGRGCAAHDHDVGGRVHAPRRDTVRATKRESSTMAMVVIAMTADHRADGVRCSERRHDAGADVGEAVIIGDDERDGNIGTLQDTGGVEPARATIV